MDIVTLDIRFAFNGTEDVLHPVLLLHKNEMILVDCGYVGFLPLVEQAAAVHGLSLERLTGLLLTHHDIDHLGAASQLKARYPFVTVFASSIEEPFISGRQTSLRLQQAEALFDSLPAELKPGAQAFQHMLKEMPFVPVDVTLADNDELMQGEVRVVWTPGHTPGHLSLYVKAHKTLVAADAVVVENGRPCIANPQFTLDLPQAVASVRKLQQMDIERLICYHGGTVEGNIDQQLLQLVHAYENVQ